MPETDIAPYLAKGYTEKYGILWPRGTDPAAIEQRMYNGKDGEHTASGFGGPEKKGKLFHFREFITIVFSHERCSQPFEWNPNVEAMLEEYFRPGGIWTMFAGHGSSAKTRGTACFLTADYLMDPEHTSCLFTSTTLPDGKRRVWADVERFWFDACVYFGGEDKMPGELVHSIAVIRYVDRGTGRLDEARGMALIPSGNNEEAKAGISKMIGYKAPRMRIGLDEGSHITWKVVECIETNLMTGCQDTPEGKDLRVMVTLNPNVKTDTGGRLCCPQGGDWKTVDTTVMKRWENDRGITIRFDGEDSPNVVLAREGKCAPHDQPWSGLLSLQLLLDQQERLGEGSANYLRQYRAIWPEGDVIETIYTEDEIRHHGGNLKVAQRSEFIAEIWSLDPSHTHDGDRCPLVCQHLVRDETRRMVLEFQEDKLIWLDSNLDPTKNKDIQLRDKMCEIARAKKISPRNFGMDITGAGRVLAGFIKEKWPGAVEMYEAVFNEKATDKPVSLLDRTPAVEKYTNLMTEIWMVGKELLMSGQFKGLNDQVIKELCSRRYGANNGKDPQGRIELEETRKQKKRLGCSPDLANALLIGAQLARVRYGLLAAAKPARAPKQEAQGGSEYDFSRLQKKKVMRGVPLLRGGMGSLSSYQQDSLR